jgi:N-acetylglutamate synthase-like GNAT family acetyltransferase
MQIRTATKNDIPAILNLLYLSRGEQTIAKTSEYWCWKHIDNPFGSSPVFLAQENGELIGLRTMMR